jgi:hypothetical protein
MCHIEFNYLYRDYANYKNHNCIVFSNRENISLEKIKADIESKLIDGCWFYADKWQLPDLHFEKWDREIDHNYHEFSFVQSTNDAATDVRDIKEFLQQL